MRAPRLRSAPSFQVGINFGDVFAEDHDIFGDGVNVAAWLEALAEPSGICVSRVVRDQVRDRLDFAFEDVGTSPGQCGSTGFAQVSLGAARSVLRSRRSCCRTSIDCGAAVHEYE
jgi:class 3 adenylate cyclase